MANAKIKTQTTITFDCDHCGHTNIHTPDMIENPIEPKATCNWCMKESELQGDFPTEKGEEGPFSRLDGSLPIGPTNV
jgi:transcription elongation factor Elf1